MDQSSELAGLGAAHRPKFFGNKTMGWADPILQWIPVGHSCEKNAQNLILMDFFWLKSDLNGIILIWFLSDCLISSRLKSNQILFRFFTWDTSFSPWIDDSL
jgi:hypothetical protein